MADFIQDCRFAIRSLLRVPGLSLIAIFTLALGIGANTAIFSLIDSVFLHSLPFWQSEELVRIYGDSPERSLTQVSFSVPKFLHFRSNQTVFTNLEADQGIAMTLSGIGEPVQINGDKVTATYLSTLGVQPILGRLFRPEEEESADVAIVSRRFWSSRLNSDRDIIGKAITLDGVAHTVVGVIEDQSIAFFGPSNDVWTTHPFEFPGLTTELRQRGVSFLRVIGRLKPGITVGQSQEAVNALGETYRTLNGEKADSPWRTIAVPLFNDTVGGFRSTFAMLFGAVVFVLLIACTNVANLLLVRCISRRREFAVRAALGAGGLRIIRLFLIESLMLNLAALGLGTFFAMLSLRLLPALTDFLPIGPSLAINPAVLAVTLGVALTCSFLVGIYPAWQAVRMDVVSALKDSGRNNTASRDQQRFRSVLLCVQVGVSYILLIVAFLLIVSFTNLQREKTGFSTERLLIVSLNLPAAKYGTPQKQIAFDERLQERVRMLPGIRHAVIGTGVPLTGFDIRTPYARADGDITPLTKRSLGLVRSVFPGWYSALGIGFVAGRDFTTADTAESPQVVIISRATAEKLFPGENAIGRRLMVGSVGGGQNCEIVGLVDDVRSVLLSQKNEIELYRPLTQRGSAFLQFVLQTEGDNAAAVLPALRGAIKEIDPEMPLNNPQAMRAILESSLGQQRLLTSLLGSFAAIALVLTTVGIYGAVSFTVSQKKEEIGIRIALGANQQNVLSLVLSQGLRPVVLGLLGGIIGSLGVGRLIGAKLYAVSSLDPVLITGTALLLVIVAIVACLLPALRAIRVDPLIAMRSE